MADSFFDRIYKNKTRHTPDVLSCLANLSNDEVFTPPDVVNGMLDLLPQELFRDPNTTFLDPACKTGVFLREIAKRLLAGLEDKIPDLQERIDHIFHKQLFGIAITELTSLLSRRSLYCSKYPNGPYSVTKFEDAEGNIRYKRINHTWGKDGKCVFCGASREQWDRGKSLETYAYEFIHTSNPKEIFNMKFDVIISNPPYQLSFGLKGANSSNAKSIYNLFIDRAIKLNPRYIVMIVPSRWMTKTAQGIPEAWVDKMLLSNKYSIIHDFENVNDCFPGISLTGGVNYFLWDKSYDGKCHYYYHTSHDSEIIERFDYLDSTNSGIVIRNPKSYSIIEKIEMVEGQYYLNIKNNFSGLVSPKHFFDDSKYLTSNWKGYHDNISATHNVKYYLNIERERTFKWISDDEIPKNQETKDLYKTFIPAANGSEDTILGKPFIGEPGSVCSQTFLVIGYDPVEHNFSKEECENIISYIKTKFFRYLVSIKKKTQNGPRGVYQFVPLQDFSKPWTDEELYAKYKLTPKEIDFIESMIKPME